MSIEDDIRRLLSEMDALPESERLGYLKGWTANHPDPHVKALIHTTWAVLQSVPQTQPVLPDAREQVVVLLHGIRTEGAWQSRIAANFRNLPNVKVFPIGYGWFDAISFWLPAWVGFRTGPTDRVLRELRDIRSEHPNADMVIVAHSFSTYLVSRILQEHTDIRLSKLVLCGSIIPLGYRWDRVKGAEGGMTIVNEVGTKDIWPVLARVTSWGYGPSGALGFGTHRVRDRFFDYAHSDFFSEDHVRDYWLTFVRDGTIADSPWDLQRPKQPWHLGVASGIPWPKVTIPLIVGALTYCLVLLVAIALRHF